MSSPTTFPAYLAGYVDWWEAGIALTATTASSTTTTAAAPPPAVHPTYVGGEMLSVNVLRVVGPWIAAMLALTIVAVDTLILRRRKNRKP